MTRVQKNTDLDSVRCPRCRKPVSSGGEHFPFCSDRCRLLDLGSWFAEDYRVSRHVVDDRMLDELLDGEGDGHEG